MRAASPTPPEFQLARARRAAPVRRRIPRLDAAFVLAHAARAAVAAHLSRFGRAAGAVAARLRLQQRLLEPPAAAARRGAHQPRLRSTWSRWARAIDDYVPAVAARGRGPVPAERRAARSSSSPTAWAGWWRAPTCARTGAARVARIITLGTPHHGTCLASLGPGANARPDAAHGRRATRPETPGCARWRQAKTPHARALVTSIYTHHDNIVAPQTSSILPGARNIAFGGVGHVALGADPRVLSCILHELAREEPFTRIRPVLTAGRATFVSWLVEVICDRTQLLT